jgi:hypothetical protein
MKKFLSLIIVVVLLFSFSGCFDVLGAIFHQCPTNPYRDPSDYPEYPDYQSEYTQQEHIARLTAITESGAWKGLDEQFSLATNLQGNIISFEVEIVYSLCDNDPEFFLIDCIFENYDQNHIITGQINPDETNEAFLFGYIQNDEYYIILMHSGKNPWAYAGYPEEKKYFGSYCCAVELNGEMTMIFEITEYQHFLWGSGDIVSQVLSEQEKKDYMEYNYLCGDYRKYEMKEPTVE